MPATQRPSGDLDVDETVESDLEGGVAGDEPLPIRQGVRSWVCFEGKQSPSLPAGREPPTGPPPQA